MNGQNKGGMKTTQKGITLIELVVVIVILSVFAAIAAPKFVDTTSKTATAAVNASQDGFKTAYALAMTVAADTSSLPDVDEVLSVYNYNSAWTCTAATGVCTSPDWDADGNPDLTITMWVTSDCSTTAVTASTDLIKGYDFDLNSAGAATCQTAP